MSFTDEDLNRMEIACLLSVEEYRNQDAKDILALIARLKAAEMVVTTPHLHGLVFTSQSCPGCRATKIWRKAAGK